MSATATKTKAPSRANSRSRRTEHDLEINGRTLRVSNLNKVLYPKAGFTKGEVLNYYIRVSPALLPHLKDRALTLKRYPDGVEGNFFYEKRCPPHRPDWVKTAEVWSESKDAPIHFCLANDLETLVWAVNLADLELHTSLAKVPKVDQPTAVAFDLDPGPPANIVQCAVVALKVRRLLEEMNLESFPKTSGSKGLQIYLPLNSPADYDQTKGFARHIAETLTREHPREIVARMDKKLRTGKVFIDWSQNDRHKTTVCVYSLRAKDRPTVSTPVTWDEVERAARTANGDHLVFEHDVVLQRLDRHGDLFEPVLKLKQKLRWQA